ncbi:hypothetical protein AB0H76_34645 [Nocardia sp. NPDC050712]|uniref:hypothetical protein n=1 Tax=Nocardia sp. NPDC050712 TaxID=3155518 RepID=UPI0033D0C256
MDLRTPMHLYRNQDLVGSIVGYGYETPWATGSIEDVDADRAERSDRVAEFLRWADEDVDDDAFDAEMARRGVTQADVDWCRRGDWVIRTRDGIDHRVYSLDFLTERTIQWRW